jgi:crossover junction endodeoxyribonuclease RuvC
MFTMGRGLGTWEGVLAGLGIPYELVTPQRWKKALMDGMGKDKDASRLQAIRLFPAIAGQLARKKDDGRADALLIAEYGRRTRG